MPNEQSTDAKRRSSWPFGDRFVLLAVLAGQGFTLAINGVAAPWMMRSFNLDQAGMARAFAWIATSAIGAFALARAADRIGRRTLLRVALVTEAAAAIGAACARTLGLFIAFDLFVISCAGAISTCAVVWLAELSSNTDRARWQGLGGFAVIAGSGPCVLLMPQLAETAWSWRTLLLFVGMTPLLLPLLPYDRRTDLPGDEALSDSSDGEIIPAQRSRRTISIALIVTTALSTVAAGSVESWRYFHLVHDARVPPAWASWGLIAAGASAVVGFPVGAFISNRLGRIRTVVVLQFIWTGAIVWAFWGPPGTAAHPLLWVAGGLSIASACFNGATVASNTAIAELYPAALRATIFGSLYLVGSLGRVIAHTLVAITAPRLGGVAAAVGTLALLAIPSVALLALFVNEPQRRHAQMPALQPRPTDAS